MYEILLDGKSLYYPGDSLNAVTEAKITEALNDSGYMDILVPPTNPLYGNIYERKSEIEVRKDSFVIWKGEVVDISENMKKEKMLYVVGDMSYLSYLFKWLSGVSPGDRRREREQPLLQ